MVAPVDMEIKQLIHEGGPITFAQFMQRCLYSSLGGFYSFRTNRISSHFGTSPTTHPVFGELIALQLEQMWHLLGEPPHFYVIEVGSGDGALARSIVDACRRFAPRMSGSLRYVATDYEPWWPPSSTRSAGLHDRTGDSARPDWQETTWGIERVKAEGLSCFRNVIGCILSNELVDNFPVHRFAIQAGEIKEIFVTLEGDRLIEVLDKPSTPRIEERLASLGVSLLEGSQGEVNLAMEDWTDRLVETLDRGFILTIDYGNLAQDLYSFEYVQGTLVCFNRHVSNSDPYQHIGQQDITAHVDFTSLVRLGERRGLIPVGYTLQRHFLLNLGFASFLEVLQTQGLSYARTELRRVAMMALIDPEQMGGFKVLAQAKGVESGIDLLGFKGQGT